MDPLPESPLSLWLDEYGPYEASPPLQGSQSADIAVIGGGFTGLVTAYEIKRAEPALRVALLEAKTAGYGASGRNGSFGMTVVGLGFSATALLRGRGFLKDAHTYMERAVDAMDDLILRENLDCQRLRPGFLRVATSPAYARKLQHEVELMSSLGFDGIFWLDRDETCARVASERYLGAVWEPRLVLVDPARLARAEKQLALRAGVQVFENSQVISVSQGPPYTLRTSAGSLKADKLIYALNAYAHLFPGLRRRQIPAFTYMIATAPLTAEQLVPIGWQGQEGLEDARNLVHYYRLTPDRRIVLGGGPVGITFANSLQADSNQAAWRHLERYLHFLFPHLKGIEITHRWGGPFSVTTSLTPAIGALDGGRTFYSLGCIGHGVSTSHLNAQTLRDLVLERSTDLVDGPFVNRRSLLWPPEPLRSVAALALRSYLQLEDRYNERSLPRL
jgi:glycine/D-amino acid oxidase-like deaminating enzyme